MRLKIFIFLLLVSTLCHAQIVSISSLKKIRTDTVSLIPESNRKYMVSGYLYKDPTPLLISDTFWMYANARIPDTSYLLLESMFSNVSLKLDSVTNGSYLEIGGYLNPPSNLGFRKDADFKVRDVFKVRQMANRAAVPTTVSCSVFPRMCTAAETKTANYALLYSGGIDTVNAHIRYWNNIKFLYNTLVSKYGYQHDHIIVVYKSGHPEDAEMNVDFPATPDGLNAAFVRLSQHITNENDLVLYMTNHGGGFNEDSTKNFGGLDDAPLFDEVDKYKLDEVSYYYEQYPENVLDDEFAERINGLRFRRLIGVFQQCFSGGFLRDLRGENRVILSAANEFEFSWSDYDQRFDVFSYFFISALNEADPWGKPVNGADTDHDGRISILEAFKWARDKDKAYLKPAKIKETPQLEDTGDGVSTNNPQATQGKDGWLANRTFLR